ncbi:hypothetical protein BD289DRAFT_447202 [Coniella lustricola]|uniref:Uncharacterized protein n=1 Tax=Coniella lustricola TaxID=2025994 RepID=A0A2T2ZTA8_9PEZI|nr:hypothetical protein BD289DRAFT_447202 [Coniella lustricola]
MSHDTGLWSVRRPREVSQAKKVLCCLVRPALRPEQPSEPAASPVATRLGPCSLLLLLLLLHHHHHRCPAHRHCCRRQPSTAHPPGASHIL